MQNYIHKKAFSFICVLCCLFLLAHKNVQAAPFQVDVLKREGKTVIVYYDLHEKGSREESFQMFCGLGRRLSILAQRGERVRLLVEGLADVQELKLSVTSFDQFIESIRSHKTKLDFLSSFDWLQSNRLVFSQNIELVDVDLYSRNLFYNVFKYLNRILSAENLYQELDVFLDNNPAGDVNNVLNEYPNLSDAVKHMILGWVKNKQAFVALELFSQDELNLIQQLSIDAISQTMMSELRRNLYVWFPQKFIERFLLNVHNCSMLDLTPFLIEALNYQNNEYFVNFCLERAQAVAERIREWRDTFDDLVKQINDELQRLKLQGKNLNNGKSVDSKQCILSIFEIAEMIQDELQGNFDVPDSIFNTFAEPDLLLDRLMDLNAVTMVLCSDSPKDILFVGGVHANEIVKALMAVGFELIGGVPATNLAGQRYDNFQAAYKDSGNIKLLPEICFDLIL